MTAETPRPTTSPAHGPLGRPRAAPPSLGVGVVVTLVGVGILLDRMNVIDAERLIRFWPVLFIVFGLSIVTQAIWFASDARDARRRPGSGVGLLFLVGLLVGGSLLAERVERRFTVERGGSESVFSLFTIMGRDHQTSITSQFREAEMTSVMGRTVLDLRQAAIPDGADAVIDAFALMGRVEILIPEGWKVDNQAVGLMGRVSDYRRTAALEADVAAPRVVVRGVAIMGRIQIGS